MDLGKYVQGGDQVDRPLLDHTISVSVFYFLNAQRNFDQVL